MRGELLLVFRPQLFGAFGYISGAVLSIDELDPPLIGQAFLRRIENLHEMAANALHGKRAEDLCQSCSGSRKSLKMTISE